MVHCACVRGWKCVYIACSVYYYCFIVQFLTGPANTSVDMEHRRDGNSGAVCTASNFRLRELAFGSCAAVLNVDNCVHSTLL